MPEPANDSQFDLKEIVEIAPDALSDEQKTFLETKVEDLTDEQAESFGLKKAPPPPVEPELRKKPPAKKPDEPPTKLDDEVDSEDAAMIGKVVAKAIKPLQDQIAGQTEGLQANTDAKEVDALIREKPEFESYRDKILVYMKDPSYSNIPAGNIAKIVAGDDLMKMGAEKEREAVTDTAKTKGVGGTARKPEGEGKNWLTATKEEFEAKRAEVLGRRV